MIDSYRMNLKDRREEKRLCYKEYRQDWLNLLIIKLNRDI